MDKTLYTLIVHSENIAGLLNQITAVFTRRQINIESLNTSPSEAEGIHRFTLVIHETEEVIKKICRQLEKQIDVLKAYYNTDDEIVWQEQALYKVPTHVVAEKVYVERLLRQYGASTVVIRQDYIVFETAGHREEIDRLTEELNKYGLIEFVRGARIATIKKSDGFHKKLMEFDHREPSPNIVENEYLDQRDDVFTM